MVRSNPEFAVANSFSRLSPCLRASVVCFCFLMVFLVNSDAQMMGAPQMQQGPTTMQQAGDNWALQNANQQAMSGAQHPSIKAAEGVIDPEKIRAHVRFLADDLLEGRYPGLRGGDLAAQYVAT